MGFSSSPKSTGNPSSDVLIYASFCGREPSPNNDVSNWLACYNSSNNSWYRVSMIPGLLPNHVLKGFSMVVIGDWIYLIGGRLCVKVADGDLNNVVEVDVEVVPHVLRYNVCNDMWCKCAPLSIPRFDFACSVSDGKIYIAGGKCKLGSAKGISSAEVYDPALDEWKPLPSMSTLRYKCVGVTWKGKFHVIGGFAGRGGSWYTMERSSAEVYDADNAKWDLILGMWQLDVPPNQIIAIGEKLFSSGDCLNAWKGHIEAYDGELNMWNEVDGSRFDTISNPFTTSAATEASSSSIQRLYLAVAPIGTRLYYLVGYKMPDQLSRMMSTVHVFDTSANIWDGWTSFEPVEEEGEKELCGPCCVVGQIIP